MRKGYILGLVLIVAAFATGAYGQDNSNRIEGVVLDSNGAPIVGANVSVRNSVGVSVRTVETKEDGGFEIDGLPNGNFIVAVSAIGFEGATKPLLIGSNSEFEGEFTLRAGGVVESVSVTATRSQVAVDETASSVSVIGREAIERRGLNTIGDLFRNLSGVGTVNEGAFQVRPRIRGFDSNRVLVLVDGERLNNARTSTIQSGIEIGLVGVDQIESVEVVRGGGSVLYGTDALGGTINILTRDAERNLDGGFRFSAGLNGFFSTNETGRRGTATVMGSGDSFSFRISQSLDRFDNYKTGSLDGREISGVNSDGEVLNSQSHGASTRISTRFFLDDDKDMRFSYDRQRTGNIGVPTLVGVFNAYFPFSNRDKFSGRFEARNISDNFARLNLTGYFQNQNRQFDTDLNVPASPPFFPGQTDYSRTTTDTNSFGADFQTDWMLPRDNFLTAGFSFFRDSNEDERYRNAMNPNFGVFPPGLINVVEESPSLPNAKFGSLAGFVQDQVQIINRLKLIGGIRFEHFYSRSNETPSFAFPSGLTEEQIEYLGLTELNEGLDTKNNAITGDIAAIVRITDALDYSVKLGRSYRVPNLFERFYTGVGSIGGIVVGNPNLEPESGINFENGIRFSNQRIAASATYFNNYYKNLLSNEEIGVINGTPVAIQEGLYQTVNIGKARIQGVEGEFVMPFKFDVGYLTPSINISYLRGDDLESGVPLTTITPLKTVFNLRWQNYASSYYFDLNTRVVNKQTRLSEEFISVNGGAEPGFAVTDLGIGYVINRESLKITLNSSIRNIFNRFYSEQYVLAPARGRSYIFSTSWEIN